MKKYLLLILVTPFVYGDRDINLNCEPFNVVICANEDSDCGTFSNEDIINNKLEPMEVKTITISETIAPDNSKIYFLNGELANKVASLIRVVKYEDDIPNPDMIGKRFISSIDVVSKEYKDTMFELETNKMLFKATYNCNEMSSLLD